MIQVTHVGKTYGDKPALVDICMDVPDGIVTGFVGPNGAGKTTLMRIIGGLISADSGTAMVDGRPFTEAPLPAHTLGICLSPGTLPPTMSGRRLLEYACITQGIGRTCVSSALDEVGLSAVTDKRIGTYSTGMRQRLGIALALLGNPRNLILDEPINGLDMNGVRWLRDVIRARAAGGAAILLSSHVLSELALVADSVVMLSQGAIVARGTVKSLSATASVETYVESPALSALVAALERQGIATTTEGRGAKVGADPLLVSRIAFESELLLTHLTEVQQSLEDIYVQATDGEGGGHE